MAHIYDILNNRKISYYDESTKLLHLLEESDYFYTKSLSTNEFYEILEACFRHLPLAGNYINLYEFLKKDEFYYCNDVESFCLLCEKVLTLFSQTKTICQKATNIEKESVFAKIEIAKKVINYDLEISGFKISEIIDDKFGKLIVVYPNDSEILKAIEFEPDLTEFIINYSRPSNKGNLVEKEKCLHFIIKGVEHITDDKSFGFLEVSEQARVIFNMFHLRHDNKKGKMKNAILSEIKDDELEEIFDMGYRLSLELIILNEFQGIDTKISELRKRIKQ